LQKVCRPKKQAAGTCAHPRHLRGWSKNNTITNVSVGSLQLGEQSVSLLEIPRVEALREAAMDGAENIARLGTLALIVPKPGQVGCRAKLERSRLLAACRPQSLIEQGLRLGVRCAAHEQRARL